MMKQRFIDGKDPDFGKLSWAISGCNGKWGFVCIEASVIYLV